MLTFLNISNIALIDELKVEFEPGLNLLTGETGSGKSIIVDALGVLIGGRFTSDLLKASKERGFIEGLFSVDFNKDLRQLLVDAGIESDTKSDTEIIIRRELALNGRNKIFINHQLATQTLLRQLQPYLVDIHGQGDQQTLFDATTHMDLLDTFAGTQQLREEVADCHRRGLAVRRALEVQGKEDAERFQLIDILRFQIDELECAKLVVGEDERFEDERRRLNNVEKLTTLCSESFALIYEDSDSAITRMRRAARQVEELSGFESKFGQYLDGLETSRTLLEDLAFSLRDYADKLEFSPARLEDIESRLAELSRLKRKYGGSIETCLEHLARSQDKLRQIERSDETEARLRDELSAARGAYLELAKKLHRERVRSAKKFERSVERDLDEVAMEHARFQIQITAPPESRLEDSENTEGFTPNGIDQVEFCFSANVGEDLRPLARVASGGEASRLMLVLKTVAGATEFPRTIVFDEIDTGIGGRVSEAVGLKLKKLSETNQVFCVTHQPQIARFADAHLLVRKQVMAGRTEVSAVKLDRRGRVEEIARMLTGAEITETARRHARELLK
jgi:DNA repair protein RecN (Recombination protein N)